MADTADRIKTIRANIDAATQSRLRSEMERDAAVASQATARQKLEDEFGVKTSEDAQRLLSELDVDLEIQLTEVETALGRATSD